MRYAAGYGNKHRGDLLQKWGGGAPD